MYYLLTFPEFFWVPGRRLASKKGITLSHRKHKILLNSFNKICVKPVYKTHKMLRREIKDYICEWTYILCSWIER